MFFTGAPAFAPDAVVVADAFGQVYRFDPAPGERLWDFAVNEPVTQSPVVVAGGTVLVATVGRPSRGHRPGVGAARAGRARRGAGSCGALRSPPHPWSGVRGGLEPVSSVSRTTPTARSSRVVSPTELDLPKLLLGNFLAAAVPLAVLLCWRAAGWCRAWGRRSWMTTRTTAMPPVDEGIEGGEA